MEHEEHPFGQSAYYNYDPDQINSVEDAIEFFHWLADKNEDRGEVQSAAVQRDCAKFLERTLTDEYKFDPKDLPDAEGSDTVMP